MAESAWDTDFEVEPLQSRLTNAEILAEAERCIDNEQRGLDYLRKVDSERTNWGIFDTKTGGWVGDNATVLAFGSGDRMRIHNGEQFDVDEALSKAMAELIARKMGERYGFEPWRLEVKQMPKGGTFRQGTDEESEDYNG